MTQQTDTQTTPQPANIVEKIAAYISRYVQVGDGSHGNPTKVNQPQTILHSDALRILALWVLHTWTFDGNFTIPQTTPYLYIFSAERRSGKTRLLEVLETVIRNPLRAADVTSAVLFRMIETLNPTILLDEVDAIWSGAKNEELRGVLNAGYKRGGTVWRVEKMEPRQFNVFGPKALAGIDNAMLPDTIRDRCIPIHMHRQTVGATEAFYSSDVSEDAEALMADISAWILAHYQKIAESERPNPIDGISDRAWEIARPLVMLSAVFGKTFTKETREAVKRLLTTEEQLSPQAQLLSDIRDLFDEHSTKTLPVALIVDKLGGSWTGKLVASRLHPYGVKPTTIRHHNVVARGYRREDFEQAWEAYLS